MPATSSFISRTARSKPTSTARATMLWPMLSSLTSGIWATPRHVAIGQTVTHVQQQTALDRRTAGGDELDSVRGPARPSSCASA